MNFINQIILGDCLDILPLIPDKSINLICADYPYNQGTSFIENKLSWDKLEHKTYLNFIFNTLKHSERLLKDNGSIYFFHNNFKILCEIQNYINENIDFEFKQFIVWNKRFNESKMKGFLDGYVVENRNRNYYKMCEYILYYIKTNNKENPFVSIIKQRMSELNLKQSDISPIILSKNNKQTGWLSNILNGMYLPTEDIWNKLCEKLNLNEKYDKIFLEYKNLIYTFNNQKIHHSVWNYDTNFKKFHPTQKPLDLIKNIILHSSNENDIVLDFCAGSGTLAEACIKTNRQYICIEKDEKYYNIACDRVKDFF